MQRVCFHLKVRKDRTDEYRARHRAVWPEMRDALRATGWHNYSLFLDNDGLLTGYFECEDFQECIDGMGRLEVNARWQAEMAPYFEGAGGAQPDRVMRPLPEIFHLE
jgi:L-rhamnose mutarotase